MPVRPSRHQLIVVALGVVTAGLIAEVGGIVFGWDTIGPSVIEGIAAIVLTSSAVGAIVAFLQRRSEGARWEVVRRRTLRTLQHHLVDSVQILVRDDTTAGGPPPVFDRWDRKELNEPSLPRIVAEMRREVEAFDRASATRADLALQNALHGVVYHLNRAVERSMLRVMTLADEKLVALIVELDDETGCCAHCQPTVRRPSSGPRLPATRALRSSLGPTTPLPICSTTWPPSVESHATSVTTCRRGTGYLNGPSASPVLRTHLGERVGPINYRPCSRSSERP
jgi:hypothetical protein